MHIYIQVWHKRPSLNQACLIAETTELDSTEPQIIRILIGHADLKSLTTSFASSGI